MEKRIVLSRHDAARLRALISQQRMPTEADRETLLDLRNELDRASIVDDEHLPNDVVALDSRVLVRDLETGKSRVYTLVSPLQADLSQGRISVLAPLGTALLGYRVGDEVEWNMPGGLRRLRIEAVLQSTDSPDGPPSPTHPRDRIAA
jgi:Transcription elongation factor